MQEKETLRRGFGKIWELESNLGIISFSFPMLFLSSKQAWERELFSFFPFPFTIDKHTIKLKKCRMKQLKIGYLSD